MSYVDTITGAGNDKRFYGIYRGIIVDAHDPLKNNRLKVKVPQVTGNEITNWAEPCLEATGLSNSYLNGVFGSFQSFVTQTPVAVSSTQAILLDVVDSAIGTTLVDGSKIKVQQNGIYNFQFSVQLQNNDTTLHDVNIWLRQGNDGGSSTDIAGSNGLISVPNKHGNVPGHIVIGWNYFVNMNKEDYIQLYWSSDSTQVTMNTYAANTLPSTASVIATIAPVASPLASAGTGVWVMYEGGDPNFPVWIGTFGTASGDVPIFGISDYVYDGGGA